MKGFFRLMGRYFRPYKACIAGTFVLNVLTAFFNVFSFMVLVPVLNILFQIEQTHYEFIPWDTLTGSNAKEVALNNGYYFSQQLIAHHGPANTLLILGCALAVMTLLKTGTYFAGSATVAPLRTGVVRDIRAELYRKILALPLSFFSEEKKGDILARVSTDVNEVDVSIGASLDMVVKSPIFLIVYIATLFYISWQLTLFTLLVVPLMAFGIARVGKTLKKKSLQLQAKWSEGLSQIEETLGGLRIVKAFVAERTMQARFEAVNNEYRRIAKRVSVRQWAAHPVSELLGTCMIVVVLWFGGLLIFSGNSPIDAPTFIYYLVILYTSLQPLKELSKAGYSIQKGLASMERINKVLAAENPITEKPDALPISNLNEAIDINGVHFHYENGEREVLSDINIRIPKGKTIALVGQSGSGKSTLVDLIPRFHDVCAGTITIDGIDIRDLRIRDLRALIGNVNQEAILFNDTIFNNIAFGTPGATAEQVEQAARTANAHDFIMETEQGYQTNVGDRGCRLSGGQRQRISIARAILKNPPILILDEATSALDTESEKLVQDALERLMQQRTTIAIAHRLSTIRHADAIYVLHEGRIVEQGTHDDLIALGGHYKRLHDMQAL